MASAERPQAAPFCWGRAACFRAVSKECAKCQYGVECAQRVLGNLVQINREISVNDLIVATRGFLDKRGVITTDMISESTGVKSRLATSTNIRFDTSHLDDTLSGLSVRAGSIAKAITRAGIDMRADAKRGANSFRMIGFKPDYMSDIQDMINTNDVFTREMVRNAIKCNRSLKYSAVNNSCSFAVSAMKAMGFIKELSDGNYVIN